jgi:hypothetical protein
MNAEIREMVVGHELGAERAADLLVAGVHRDHVAIELDVVALQQQHGHQVHDAHALVVQGPAPVDVPVRDLTRVRIERPVGWHGRHDIHVAGDQHRLADRVLRLEPRNQVDFVRVGRLVDLRLDALGCEAVGDQLRRLDGSSDRVGAIELYVLRQSLGRFFGDGVPVDLLMDGMRLAGHSQSSEWMVGLVFSGRRHAVSGRR